MKQIFIGGCGRSGTTLLGALLSRKINSIATPESQFKFDFLNKASEPGLIYLRKLENNWRFNNWGLNYISLEEKLESIIGLKEFLSVIVKEYGILNETEDFEVWIDHTPNNIDYLIPISSIFPEAKFIHIIRDGRAVAASVIPLPWGPNNILGAADWWIRQLAIGLAAESFFNPDRILRVKYEDLVMNTTKELIRILDFLGLNEPIDIIDNKRKMNLPSFTSEQHKLVNAPPDRNRITSWRSVLTKRQIEIFELKALTLMQYLGYERYSDGYIRPVSISELLSIKIYNLLQMNFKNRWILPQRNKGHHDSK